MKTAMILAAGRGERLKPMTNLLPKAMCMVQQKPLIAHHIIKLVHAGFERVVINHAYLGGYIRRYLGTGANWGIEIIYSPEPPGGLETGGGIYNALSLLGQDPFLTLNADIFTDFELGTLSLVDGMKAHVVLVTNPSHNTQGDFSITSQNLLRSENKCYTYAGIACYCPTVFQQCNIGRYSVVPLLHDLAKKNLASATLYSGLWIDVGSAKRLEMANKLLE